MRKVIPFFLSLIFPLFISAQDWKTYPYHPEGSVLSFPADEGFHPEESIEWWYINSELTGENTGKPYSFMLSYFYSPLFGFDGFRILNLADDSTGDFFSETLPCIYTVLAQDHLNIGATLYGGTNESWVTLTDPQDELIPFEYQISVESEYGALDATLIALKRPLLLADSGFLYQGSDSYSYYYSLTTLSIEGTLTLSGITEPVSGTAWIDHQYGTFNPNEDEEYAWFSLQLTNGMDLNIWNTFTDENTIPDTSTYQHFTAYANDSTAFSSADFILDRNSFVFMEDSVRCYARQWHFIYDSIDITFTTLHDNHEVFLPFRFYEGPVTVEGTVGNTPVTGIGFAELLHSYEHPEIILTGQSAGLTRSTYMPITWQLLNPDDGRAVFYDVNISLNDTLNYEPVAQMLTDTTYIWDNSAIPAGTPFYIRVEGYSVDTTLFGSVTSTAPFMVSTGSIKPLPKTFAYPNPVTQSLTISTTLPMNHAAVSIVNSEGREMLRHENLTGSRFQLNTANLSEGLYLYFITEKNRRIGNGKFVIH